MWQCIFNYERNLSRNAFQQYVFNMHVFDELLVNISWTSVDISMSDWLVTPQCPMLSDRNSGSKIICYDHINSTGPMYIIDIMTRVI